MSDHSHDESQWPIIWEVQDHFGKRLTVLVSHTIEEAIDLAKQIYRPSTYVIVDSGKRKPPNKCCNKCSGKPCGT